jgi:hypothetical protein
MERSRSDDAASGVLRRPELMGPIMGSGYSKQVVQFSKGEYAFANNTEDDLAIIASSGVVPIGDDVGNTTATATAIPLGGTPPIAGLLSARTDIDMLRINTNCAGPLNASAKPIGISPNPDIRLRILDSTGTQLVADDPAVATVSSDVASATNPQVEYGLDR